MADSYGLKVSKEGETVFSTDPDKLAFTSQFPTPLVADQGTVALVLPAGVNNALVDVTHNLGYIPVAVCFIEDTAGHKRVMTGSYDGTRKYLVRAFATKLTLYAEDGSRTGASPEVTLDCYYYILRDQVL